MSKNKSKNFYDTQQRESKPQAHPDSSVTPSSIADLDKDCIETSDIIQENVMDRDDNEQHEDSNSEVNIDNDKINSELAMLTAQLQSSQMESKDWQNKAFRYMADLDNTRKQHDLDLAQSRKKTKKSLVNPLLEFLNNQYLVLTFIKLEDNEQLKKSISTLQISFTKLVADLQSQGVEIIIPLVGADFNPETMQALNSPEDTTNTKVQNIISLGLKIDNQLIQPVMVMI